MMHETVRSVWGTVSIWGLLGLTSGELESTWACLGLTWGPAGPTWVISELTARRESESEHPWMFGICG